MRRGFIYLSLLVCVGLVSCSKVKTCECTVSVTVMGQTFTESTSGETEGDCEDIPELKDAKEELELLASMGGDFKINCHEK